VIFPSFYDGDPVAGRRCYRRFTTVLPAFYDGVIPSLFYFFSLFSPFRELLSKNICACTRRPS
jgi:hypothetical protein